MGLFGTLGRFWLDYFLNCYSRLYSLFHNWNNFFSLLDILLLLALFRLIIFLLGLNNWSQYLKDWLENLRNFNRLFMYLILE